VIDQLNRLTPEGIAFRTLSLERDGNLIIQGYAKFHNVDLKFATKRRVVNMSVMDFKIASQLGGNEESPL